MPLNYPRIFIDLDEVLNTLTPALFNMLGARVDLSDYDVLMREAGDTAARYDVLDQARVLLPSRHYTLESFWASVTANMWANVPVSDECKPLVDKCVSLVGRDNVTILTAIGVPETGEQAAIEGKLRWLRKHLPGIKYMICTEKLPAAGACKLLIDDLRKNTDPWAAEGGTSLVWPRPWNDAKPVGLTSILERIETWVDHAFAKTRILQFA